MRVLVLGPNYAPERTAVAPFTTGLCEHLAAEGHQVQVITAFPYYPEWRVWEGYRGRLWQRERVNQVPLLRVWHFVPRRPSRLLQRLAFDLSFTVSFFLAGLFAGGCDVIYCVSPPPTLALSAYGLGKIKRAPYVIKLTDLASDAALSTGIMKAGTAIGMARAVEAFAYRKAAGIVCLCQGFVDKLMARNVPPQKLHLISDWGDTENIRPLAHDRNDPAGFRVAHGMAEGQFLALHTGNMGKKQDLMNIVRAAELTRHEPGITWMLVGEGEERELLGTEAARRNLDTLKLLPLQPAGSLPQMYASADVLLLNQKAAVEDAVIPSKLLTYLAAGQPIVAAVSPRSEAARHIRQAQCGLIVPAENPQALAHAVLELRRDPARCAEFGNHGRSYAERNFTRQRVLQQYDEFFAQFTGQREACEFGARKVAASR